MKIWKLLGTLAGTFVVEGESLLSNTYVEVISYPDYQATLQTLNHVYTEKRLMESRYEAELAEKKKELDLLRLEIQDLKSTINKP